MDSRCARCILAATTDPTDHSFCCHENVTQAAENSGKSEEIDEEVVCVELPTKLRKPIRSHSSGKVWASFFLWLGKTFARPGRFELPTLCFEGKLYNAKWLSRLCLSRILYHVL